MDRSLARFLLPLGLLVAVVASAAGVRAAGLPGSEALRAAIVDLTETFPDRYVDGPKFLARLEQIELSAGKLGARKAKQRQRELEVLKKE